MRSERRRRLALGVILAIALLAPFALHGYALYLAIEVALYAIAAAALDLLVGYAGLVSLGQAAFFGIGAYAAAIVSAHAGPQLALTLGVGFACAAIFAGLTAPLALRSAGIFFLMITLAFAQLVWATADKWHGLTGGSDGFVVAKLPLSDVALYAVCAALLLIIALGLRALVRSPFGRVLEAVRQNETRARALGLPAFWYKFWAFVIAGGLTGVAGVLHAHHRNFVSLADLVWTNSVLLLVMVLLGGARSIWGGVIGAGVFVLLQAWISSKTDKWEMFAIGAVLIGIVLFTRRGLWSLIEPGEHADDASAGVGTGLSESEASSGAQTPATARNASALDVAGVSKRFGGVIALDKVSLSVQHAERRAIIGPNGAGKSTLFAVISGEETPSAGNVHVAGRATAGMPPEAIAQLGVARTFQTSSLFTEFSVLDNVMLATLPTETSLTSALTPPAQLRACRRRAAEALERVGLSGRRHATAAILSHGEARQLELAMALVKEPSLLLLDEPLAGLAPAERERLGTLLLDLPRTVTVLLVEHDLDFAQSFADRMTVLDNGVVIADGAPADVRSDPAVIAAYLGTGGPAPARASRRQGAPLLQARAVSSGYGAALVLDDVSLEVNGGEVVAILGRNGMGKSTLLNTLMGSVPLHAGSIELAGRPLGGASPLQRARAGMTLVPQGRRMLEGLNVSEELALGARPGAWTVERVFALFPRLRERVHAQSRTLSGGEQQMVAVGRALVRNPALLMMDEPSEGLSPALVHALEETIVSLREEGETVLLAEQNVDLALAVADRVYILERGKVVEHESAAELARQRTRLERSLGL